MKIPLTAIERDESLQMRVNPISQALVREYVLSMQDGVELPAITLFVDDQGRHWVGDGWHRLLAAESLALSEIESDVRPGGRRAAFQHALRANSEHGLRRTNADKANCVKQALSVPEIRQMSDREIGRMCGVDHKSVGKLRAQMPEGALFDAKRMGRDGRIRRVGEKAGISPLGKNVAVYSALGGAGGEPKGFNVVKEMRELEGTLAEEFERWPAEKRHAFCVAAANFAKLHDPEIAKRKQDAFDEMLTPEGDKPVE